MSKIVYTKEQLDWMRENYKTMNCRMLTKAFNAHFGLSKTHTAIRAALTNHKITCKRTPIQEIKIFTPEQVKFLKKNYPTMSQTDLLKAVNSEFGLTIKANQLRAFLQNHGILSGRTGHIKKGSTPWNKGKTGYMGPNRTSFKKGNLPHNTRHLWFERISKDGYIEISVPETNPHTGYERRYRTKHSWLWEQHHGRQIPAGCVVIFKDGNNRNFDLANLKLVSRCEHLCLNLHGYKNAPESIRPTIMSLAKLEAKAGFRTAPGKGRVAL